MALFGEARTSATLLTPIFKEPKSLTPMPGELFWLGSFVPSDSRIRDLLDQGVKYYFSQTDPWTSPDDPESQYPIETLRAQQRIVTNQGGRWGVVIHTAFPAYEDALLAKEGSVNWIDGERLPSWSPWDPDRLPWAGQKLAFVRDRLRPLDALGLGIFGEYGDASFYTGSVIRDTEQSSRWMQRFGVEPPRPGFWCGEPSAQASWEEFLRTKYGSVEGAYRAWGLESSLRVPKPIGTGYPITARLDFLEWYRSAMPQLVSGLCKVAREVFQKVPMMVPLSPQGDSARLGVDVYSLVQATSREGAIVKVGTVGYYPFALNWVLSLGRVRTALRAAGAPAWTEAPFLGDPGAIHQRIAESLALGAGGHIDWPQAYREERENLLSLFPLTVTEPTCPIAVIYPSSWATLQGVNPAPPTPLRILALLRDYMDFDVLEESAVIAGVLRGYRVGVLIGGTIWKPETLRAIREWVSNGGVLFGYDFGKMSEPGGDTSVYQDLFGYASSLSPAVSRLRWAGNIPSHYRVTVGSEGDEEFLSGRWGASEAGSRVAYDGALIRIPVEKGAALVVSLGFVPQQRVSQGFSLRVGDSVVAEIDANTEMGTLEFPVNAEQTARGWLEISFWGFTGGVGVRVRSVSVRRAGALEETTPLIGYFEDPVIPELVKNSWIRKFGKGLVAFMPGKADLWRQYISLIQYGVAHLSELDQAQTSVPIWDGRRDHVYTTELSDGVLYYNDSSQEASLRASSSDRHFTIQVPPKRFMVVPKHASLLVLAGWNEEKGEYATKVLSGSWNSVRWDLSNQRIQSNKEVRIKVLLPGKGRFRVFLRTLVDNQLVPVKLRVGQAVISYEGDTKSGDFIFVGEFDFPEDKVEVILFAEFDFVLGGMVFTDDSRVIGYRLVGVSAGTANLEKGITRP
ncbi:MAG: hypothetical protein QXI19_05435 [Candidatus Caldarchaeum sp.]